MNTTRTIWLNEERVAPFRKVTAAAGRLLLFVAFYLFVGGVLRTAFFRPGPGEQHTWMNAFGFTVGAQAVLSQTMTFVFAGVFALGIGDYMEYVLGPSQRPRFGPGFLPTTMIAGAIWGALMTVWSLVQILAQTHPVDQAQLWVSLICSTSLQLATAATSLGLAIALKKLHTLIADQKGTV